MTGRWMTSKVNAIAAAAATAAVATAAVATAAVATAAEVRHHISSINGRNEAAASQCIVYFGQMEGLESSGPMTSNSSDPLLSATLPSSSPPQPDSYRNHIRDDNYSAHSRNSPHSQSAGTTTAFNQYTTLTPLQPLPPISTVTNSSVKFNRSTASPAVTESPSGTPSSGTLFFQQTPTNSMPGSLNFGSFAYNVNIKYVYDMKNEPDTEDGQSADSNNDSRNEYTTPVTLHQQLHQLPEPFSPSQSPYVPSYSGVLEPKQEKLDFISSTSYNTFNGPSDILDTETMETVKRKNKAWRGVYSGI
ncbi:unnamed protein product [Acanthocheilonema viteae]|uniref:Uncharacterized protein n=1 Tax=Acanthocheilonema viteae TaxID=6277 RepID=A0A498SW18_ACAVI|nr:unnamed protein product [Acanthocheilonema viteae]